MPRLLDLFCKAGGAGYGYHLAGFEVVGVDIEPQPHYPFEFHQMDAFDAIEEMLGINDWWWGFDAVHASPPCQKFSSMTSRWGRQGEHQDLIEATRRLLVATGLPFVIENVMGAPLQETVVLCGSQFGLGVRRHRQFEIHGFSCEQPRCRHEEQSEVVGVYGNAGGSSKRDGKKFGGVDAWRTAMGIDWMIGKELAQAIPWAYTKYIGESLLKAVTKPIDFGKVHQLVSREA